MICYRDTTFCTAECANTDCAMKLTPAVTEAARQWWGSEDAPIATGDRSEGCANYQPQDGGADGKSGNG